MLLECLELGLRLFDNSKLRGFRVFFPAVYGTGWRKRNKTFSSNDSEYELRFPKQGNLLANNRLYCRRVFPIYMSFGGVYVFYYYYHCSIQWIESEAVTSYLLLKRGNFATKYLLTPPNQRNHRGWTVKH